MTPPRAIAMLFRSSSRGSRFMAISAGPLFKFNPSVSFHVKMQDEGRSRCNMGKTLTWRESPYASRRLSVQRAVWLDRRQVRTFLAGDFRRRIEMRQKISPVLMLWVGYAARQKCG